MTNTVFVELVTPEKLFFSQDAQSVIVPGSDGDIGVLPHHAPLISTLRAGVVTIEGESGTSRLVVTEGFAEVTPERCTILAENAHEIESLSMADLELRIDALKADLEKEYHDSVIKEKEKKLSTLHRVLDVLKAHK